MPEAAKYRGMPYNTGKYYARKQRTNGRNGSDYYMSEGDYQKGRFQATGTNSSQRAGINRKTGGHITGS